MQIEQKIRAETLKSVAKKWCIWAFSDLSQIQACLNVFGPRQRKTPLDKWLVYYQFFLEILLIKYSNFATSPVQKTVKTYLGEPLQTFLDRPMDFHKVAPV